MSFNPLIRIKSVSRRFMDKNRTFLALDDISLDIEKGDVFGLIGFSGAGKSTLLRMINALEVPSSGEISVDGKNLASLKSRELSSLRKEIGMIFQEFNLLESKTVFENISIPLILQKRNKEEIESRVNDMLSFVGLEEKALVYPRELSGGQKQRVGIARALATAPKILLCDEATSALDPETTDAILDLLRKINERLKVTIIFVTHSIRVIQRLCNKVAILEHGKLVETGSVIEVFSSPKSTIARAFVETVIPSRIPDKIRLELEKYQGFYKLIRIYFHSENATDDVIYQINHSLNVHTNVMFASVTEIQGVVLSIITLQLTGDEEDYIKATRYISSKNLSFEELML